jgi:hypothetical protein
VWVAAGATLAGCGFGPGKTTHGASMIVTRDFGTRLLAKNAVDTVPGSDTQIRFLQRGHRLQTSYGGRFVNSIDGLSDGQEKGRAVAWLYYVNGEAAPKGAADTPVHAGDRVWWDRHDYAASRDVPAAIVGAFPAPFTHNLDGRRPPVRLECSADAGAACDRVAQKLTAVGVIAARTVLGTGAGKETLRVLVGPWASLRRDGAASPIERGPSASGVYVRPRSGGRTFDVLAADGSTSRSLGAGSGLIAATRFEDQQPAWLVTGTDAAGALSAADALDEHQLQRRFALVASGGRVSSAPDPAAP